jgi:hypothetical protein
MSMQNTRRSHTLSLLTGLMVVVLAIAGTANAQSHASPGPDGVTVVNPQPKAPAANPIAPAKATASGETSRGPLEGVKVHGHWIIDVKNPDGTLAQHRDFENSLIGTNDMVGLLYGSEVASDFAIYLSGSTNPCSATSAYYCDIVHNLSVLPASARCGGAYDYCVTGLTVTPTFGQNPALVLAGSLTATQAGSVSLVGTFIGICGGPSTTLTTTSASSCAAGNNAYGYGALTQTSITSVPIINGQIIQVTVTITFS